MAEFKNKGGFVHELTPAQRAEWRKLVEPDQLKLVKEIGGQAPELWAAIQKGKKEYADAAASKPPVDPGQQHPWTSGAGLAARA